MTDHQDIADEAERELEALRKHSDEVGEEIAFAKEKFAETDEMPPSEPLQGAVGKSPQESGAEPEAQYPAKD